MKKVGIVVAVVLVVLCGLSMFALRTVQARRDKTNEPKPVLVEKGDLRTQVIETGTLEAVKTVEVKSRVSGRVRTLFVDEGDVVRAGDLIAIIDPQETELRVKQDRAQLKGALSSARRVEVEIDQRRVTAQTALDRAKSRLRQLDLELKAQPTLTSAAVRAATSALHAAEKSHDMLVGVAHPRARVAAQGELSEAETSQRNAAIELERRKELLAKGYVAQRDYESAELQAKLAETRLANAREKIAKLDAEQALERQQSEERVNQSRAELDRAKANTIQDSLKSEQYGQAVADVRDAEANLKDVLSLQASRDQQLAAVEQLRSVLSDSERQLGETEIRAPIAGVITKRLVQEGELVASLSSFSSGTPIVKLEDRSGMIVKLSVNEIDVARLTLGMATEITVDAFSKDTFKGSIRKIAPSSIGLSAVTPGSDPVVKYEIEVSLVDRDPRLKSGMSAKCKMTTFEKKGVLRLPIEFVGDEKGERFVLIAPADKRQRNAKPTRQKVTVGEATDTYIEILTGVTEGQEVVKPEYSGPPRQGMMSFGPDDE